MGSMNLGGVWQNATLQNGLVGDVGTPIPLNSFSGATSVGNLVGQSPLGSLLGTSGGASGTGFAGPGMAPIANPVQPGQIGNAYTGVQGGLAGQGDLAAQIRAQNGLANQSNVYGQLANVASGQGPNPAQAMLNQATAQNIQNQAGMMAGQRGANQNVGMLARQAANQGAQTQQQAAAQAATMQANQQLGALGQMGGMANNMAANQIGQTNANTQAQLAEQNALLGAQQGYNTNLTSGQASVNAGNAGLAQTQMQGQQGLLGGLMSGAGMAGAAMLMAAKGGKIPHYDEGGEVASGATTAPQPTAGSAYPGQSKFGAFLSKTMGNKDQPFAMSTSPTTGGAAIQQGLSNAGAAIGNAIVSNKKAGTGAQTTDAEAQDAIDESQDFAKGGKVPAMVSPGEVYLKPKEVQKVKKGADPIQAGEKIPGKPKHPGNDYRNDVVPKTLEEGGIVIPNKVLQSKSPHWAAMRFVHAHMAKGGKVMMKSPKKAAK